jgi:hypothetical protein
MVITPLNKVPIDKPLGTDLDLIIFPIYQTREDYRQQFGAEPPPPDPTLRSKYWFDPQYSDIEEDNGEVAVYQVVRRDPRTGKLVLDSLGRPQIAPLVIPAYIAGRVNIPYGRANEFPPDAVISRLAPYPVPVRPLHGDEELRAPATPFSDSAVVVNVRLAAQQQDQAEGFTPDDRIRLKQIQALLEQISAKIK